MITRNTYDEALVSGAAAVEEMDRKLREAKRMLFAAALSSPNGLMIQDGAVARMDRYEFVIERDEANACLRVRARQKERT